MSYRSRIAAVASLFAFGFAAVAFAQKTAADIPVETFFKRAQFHDMQLSPDGKRLASLVPYRGRDNIVVIDLATRKRTIVTGFETFDVVSYLWINNDRLCLFAADGLTVSGEPSYKGVGCTDHDGQNFRDFTKVRLAGGGDSVGGVTGGYNRIEFLGLTHDGSPDVFVAAPLRSLDSVDVYRFNTMTNRYSLLTADSPGDVNRWVLDWNHVPRIAVSQPREEKTSRARTIWYRENADAKYEKLFECQTTGGQCEGDGLSPIGFDPDNTTLYVSSTRGRDKAAIYKYDTRTRKLGDLVFEHPLVDINGGLIFNWGLKKVLGIRYNADKPGVKWFDPDLEKLQKMVDATFPKTFNNISIPSEKSSTALLFTRSDVDPGMYHIIDRSKPSVESLVHTREWLDPALMSERRFITYKARDGLEIPAWVTIPKGSSGKNLPLIVNIHGGPWVRGYSATSWGRWPEAQFFASRGYVVLEPEPRGSLGYGRKHYTSSFKQWGQAMQDDITDGALHLVKEGLVDKSRMCLHGGSYGGYATAMGLAKDPDLWKCGSPFVAVTDLLLMQSLNTSDMKRGSDFLETSFLRMVGDPDKDSDMMKRYSPARQASRIKAPILLAMGSNDVRVPIEHGDALRNAVEAAGGQIEYVVYSGEGHGFNKDENVVDFSKRLEAFFAKHLKGK
jgi:dipeptidyl aminopeptidase/acylaminoacyl peptidase